MGPSFRRKVRPGEMMQVVLDVVHGPRKGETFSFDRHDTFIVGRSRYVHCAMPEDSALSRDHFLIEINPPRCELRDLGSTNGTFVNDEKVERARLSSGDRIAAGQSVFVIRLDPPDPADSPSLNDTIVAPGRPRTSVRCAGCGVIAPGHVVDEIAPGDAGSWLCDLCRGEARHHPPARPQLHRHPPVGPRRDGRRLPGEAHRVGPDGRPQADRPRDRRQPDRDRPVPPRDVGHQPAQAPQHRRVGSNRG